MPGQFPGQKSLVLIVWWPWKLGQGHQNLFKSFDYPNDTVHKVWSESIIWFKRQGADKTFLVKIWHWKCWCDLENETMSPKSNHFFLPSQWCVCASLVKIHALVQKVECRQNATYALSMHQPTTKGNNSNSIGSLPLSFYYKCTACGYQCVCKPWWFPSLPFQDI